MKKKRAIIIMIILVATGVGISSWLWLRSWMKPETPMKKVTLGVNPVDISALLFIAKNKGYFSDNGIEITFEEYEAGAFALNALNSGKVDIITASEFVVVRNSFDSDDLRILATITKGERIMIVGRKDKGLLEQGDLRGKRIGVKKGSNAEFFLGRFLVYNDLAMEDIVVLDVLPSDMNDSLKNGDTDAVVIWDPYAYYITESQGDGVVSWSAQNGQESLWLLITRVSFINENPEALGGVLRGIVEAEKFVANNEANAKEIIGQDLVLERQYLDHVWDKCTFFVSLDQHLLLIMEDEFRWMIEEGLTDNTTIPNFLNYIYPDTLKDVKPNSVSLIN